MFTTVSSHLTLLIATLFLVSFSVLNAAWTAPSGLPPTNNADAPIDVSVTTQTKAGNLIANVFAAASSTWSPRYCDEIGANCWDPSTGTPGGASWGTWTDIGFRSGWRQNTTGKGVMVHYIGARDNSQAYISPTGTTIDQVQVTSHDADSGERSNGTFIVPPGHYYSITYGGNIAELTLPF